MKFVDWDLIVAAKDGDLDRAKQCIESGTNPKVRDSQSFTALMNAAYRAGNKLVKLLLPISDV